MHIERELFSIRVMGINIVRFMGITQAKQAIQRALTRSDGSSPSSWVPRCYFPVHVGETERRFMVPISFLGNASFQNLLKKAEEEFDVDHQIGAIKLPCDEHSFLALMSTHISLFILSTI